jgi:hypothetical protein
MTRALLRAINHAYRLPALQQHTPVAAAWAASLNAAPPPLAAAAASLARRALSTSTSSAAPQQQPAKRLGLAAVDHIVAVASGKGGVGKSTVASGSFFGGVGLGNPTPLSGGFKQALTAAVPSLLQSQCTAPPPNLTHAHPPSPHTQPSPHPTPASAANLAVALAARLGLRVGLMDADVHGPSIPTLMNLEGEPLATPGAGGGGWGGEYI